MFCLLVAAVPSIAGTFIGRFLTGIASAVPSVVVEGSLEDLFDVEERIWLVYAWAVATTLGLVSGPIYGAYVAAAIGW